MDTSKHLEIALVGDFQCGKSTTFNAILGGRELSPRGVGVKTSACGVTARALGERAVKEWAEPVWRSREWIERTLVELQAETAESSESPDLKRVLLLIERYKDDEALESLRGKKRVSLEMAQRWVAYPRDWEPRWLDDPAGERFALEEILFVFLERVIFHVKSEMLARLRCDLTDAPGYGSGPWDEFLARETMVRADRLVCILDGRQSTLSKPCLDELSWLLRAGFSPKAVFAQNGENSQRDAVLAENNLAYLRQRGFELAPDAIVTYSAQGALVAQDGESGLERLVSRMESLADAEPASAKLELDESGTIVPASGYVWADAASLFSKLDKEVCWNPGTPLWNDDNIVASETENLWVPRTGFLWSDDDCTTEPRELSVALHADVLWISGLPHPKVENVITGESEDIWIPDDGYEWRDDTSPETQLRHGVRWCPGLECRSTPHVIASDEQGRFHPEPGYEWIDASSDESKWDRGVNWRPNRPHPTFQHVIAAHKEGFWVPEVGYGWSSSSWRASREPSHVIWVPGRSIKGLEHVVAGEREGTLLPEAGWHFKYPEEEGNFEVEKDFIASVVEGIGRFAEWLFD